MAKPVVAVFCMPEEGHFKLLVPLISDLAQRGCSVNVFTHARFREGTERAGGTLVDLFGRYPLELADDESMPVPCRYVSFAAHYAVPILEDLKQLNPTVVLYETFAVIGWLTAQRLGIPSVSVVAAHGDPARLLPGLIADPRVVVSAKCRRAADILRQDHGVSDASPFSYMTGISPYLNIYCEPPEFLTEAEREPLQPLAFYGCIDTEAKQRAATPKTRVESPGDPSDGVRLYVCFGTVVLRYYAEIAVSVFRAIAAYLKTEPKARALISLGGFKLRGELLEGLAGPNLEISDWVDQWQALEAADLFVTSHGLASTHEAIFHRVPMLSYPFLADQPVLAERCRQFGIAFPLVDAPHGVVGGEDVRQAICRVLQHREEIASKLERARRWEQAVIAGRSTVLRQIEQLL